MAKAPPTNDGMSPRDQALWDASVELEAVESTIRLITPALFESDDPEQERLAVVLGGLARRVAEVGDRIISLPKEEANHE